MESLYVNAFAGADNAPDLLNPSAVFILCMRYHKLKYAIRSATTRYRVQDDRGRHKRRGETNNGCRNGPTLGTARLCR